MKCGFVSILGRPNAGKSTLVNTIIQSKVSIVSPKVQTTRRRILGIFTDDVNQIVLVDTPGLFTPKKALEKAIVKEAMSAPGDADLNLYLFDVKNDSVTEDAKFIKKLLSRRKNILVLNKIDLVKPERLIEITQKFASLENEFIRFEKTFMISAQKNKGVSDLIAEIPKYLPEQPWFYDSEDITNLSERTWSSEITREKLFLHLDQELPYETFVTTDLYENFKDGSVKISQTIVVSRDTQKKIVIGKGGAMIKQIGQRARGELEKLLGKKVHLFLFVKIKEEWNNKDSFIQEIINEH